MIVSGLYMELYIFLGKDSIFSLLFSTHSVSFLSWVDFCGRKIWLYFFFKSWINYKVFEEL